MVLRHLAENSDCLRRVCLGISGSHALTSVVFILRLKFRELSCCFQVSDTWYVNAHKRKPINFFYLGCCYLKFYLKLILLRGASEHRME